MGKLINYPKGRTRVIYCMHFILLPSRFCCIYCYAVNTMDEFHIIHNIMYNSCQCFCMARCVIFKFVAEAYMCCIIDRNNCISFFWEYVFYYFIISQLECKSKTFIIYTCMQIHMCLYKKAYNVNWIHKALSERQEFKRTEMKIFYWFIQL